MGNGFATVTEDEGVLVTSAEVDGLTLSELRFPAGYVQGVFEPARPYLAVVVDGGLEKRFRSATMGLQQWSGVTMPAGATHDALFGSAGARIVIVMPRRASFEKLVQLRGRELGWLATRLASELRASDSAAPLAAAGYALELLAATTRETSDVRRTRRVPAWLPGAEELLRAQHGESIGLAELAQAVNIHPAHLARTFRVHFGVSVGEYGRRARLERAAMELTGTNKPIATIATEAGFADQSHFTRVFRRYVGTTPARYRDATRIPS